MQVIAIIQARMSSSRLPGKVLLKINNKAILEHIYQNLNKLKLIDKVIVATSTDKTDERLVNFCKKKKMNYYKGSLKNVLKRFVDIIKIYKPKFIIRVTADSPIIDLKILNFYIKNMKKFNTDCTFFSHKTTLLTGYDIFSSDLLKKAIKNSSQVRDKEHVGSFYIRKNINKFKTLKIVIPKFLRSSKYKLSIDTLEDYTNIKKLIELNKISKINLTKIVKIMKKNKYNFFKHKKENESLDNKNFKKIKINKKIFSKQLLLKI